jgi:hypothetical protein
MPSKVAIRRRTNNGRPSSLTVFFRPDSKELGVDAKGTAAVVIAAALGVGALVAIVVLAMKLVR